MSWDGGHVRQGCRGRWTEITTLADPYRKEKCVECRAVRRLIEGEYEPDPGLVDLGSVSGDEEREEGRGSGLLWWAIAAVLLATIAWWIWG